MNRKIAGAAMVAALVALVCACSDDDDHGHGDGGHTAAAVSCQAIIDACHELDVGDGPIHDCHELAHGTQATETSCAAKKAECLVTCTPSGNAGADSGH